MQVPGGRSPVAKFAYLACLPDGEVVTAHVTTEGEVRAGKYHVLSDSTIAVISVSYHGTDSDSKLSLLFDMLNDSTIAVLSVYSAYIGIAM